MTDAVNTKSCKVENVIKDHTTNAKDQTSNADEKFHVPETLTVYKQKRKNFCSPTFDDYTTSGELFLDDNMRKLIFEAHEAESCLLWKTQTNSLGFYGIENSCDYKRIFFIPLDKDQCLPYPMDHYDGDQDMIFGMYISDIGVFILISRKRNCHSNQDDDE